MSVLVNVLSYFSRFSLRALLRCGIFTRRLLHPRTDPSETQWRNSSNVTGDVLHRGWRILGSRPKIYWGQALQEVNCATVGHARVAVDHHVFTQSHCVCLIAHQRQSDSRVASNVLDFLVHRQMADYELFVFDSDPHYSDLRAAVFVECGQMSQGRLC